MAPTVAKLCGLSVVVLALTAGLGGAQPDKAGPPTAASPDGKHAARAEDKTITITDLQTQKVLVSMRGHTDRVTALAYSADGKTLASGGLDKCVSLWDTASGRQLMRFMVDNAVESVLWTADGKCVVTRETNKTVRQFDASTGQPVPVGKDKQ